MKRNFVAIIIAVVIAIIIISINWFLRGRPELTDSERFLFDIAVIALIFALQNDIKEESK